jgi:SAM-dependent methyltransferase
MSTADFFAASWQAYRALVEHDYLWHAMAGAALRRIIDERFGPKTPVRFLDLACGDAFTTSRALTGRPLARYVGVDQSPPALAAAATNVQALAPSVALVPADFLDFPRATGESFDVIYVGLSAHHLAESGLRQFFTAIRGRLTPRGVFAAYEPFQMPGEVRQDYVDRFCTIADKLWIKMTVEERELVNAHVRASDYPVGMETWNALAASAGLAPATVAMRSPDCMCQLVVHQPVTSPARIP